ncbi:MAG: hypothetical protein QG646_2598 [Euryarchaeota archaeon]|nr:hypothetical protein [Euryarchaeota archaeon]
MIYAKIKNQEEQRKLNNTLKSSQNKNWYRRLQVIQLSDKKYSVEDLSEIFNLSKATIRNYIHSYNYGGLDNLKPSKSTGRPPKIAHWTKEHWDEILEKTPDQYERLNQSSQQWTLNLLKKYLKEYYDIDVSISNIYKCLIKTGKQTGRGQLRVDYIETDYLSKQKIVKNLTSVTNKI